MREGRKAMSGGGLLSLINIERIKQIEAVICAGDAKKIAAALHEMSGPFNVRLQSADIDAAIVVHADRMSSALAMTIIADVAKPGDAPQELLQALADAMCTWIDTGRPLPADENGGEFQSALASRLMAESTGFALSSPQAAKIRLLALSRFAPAIGVTEAVLRVPVGHPIKQAH